MSSLIDRVRQANAPAPADDSVLFRLATTVAVLTGVVAAESVGELSALVAGAAGAAVVAGMVFSYLVRRRPWQWLKAGLALAVIVVFAIFVNQIFGAAGSGQLSSIEVPLAGLFTWVQVIHAFDVPARRDLLFSLAAGGALITIAGAQASSGTFVAYVGVWLAATLIGLSCSWHSMVGERRLAPPVVLASSLLVVLAVALGLLVVLPQPRAVQGLTLPSSLTSYLPINGDGLVSGSGAHPTAPARETKPGGRIGVGGYLGFGGPLDTAVRGALGDTVVMRVRAERPGYFLGMTYDTWSGQSWTQSRHDRGLTKLTGGSPFDIPGAGNGAYTTDIQTFYVEQPLPNLLFGTSQPAQVYFPTRTLVVGNDGSLRATVAITPGTVYTVVSEDDEETPAELAREPRSIPAAERALPEVHDALQLPHPYPRVEALARSIVRRAHARSTVAIVEALEHWIGRHTRYSTAIPPLAPGQDAVDEFLFGNRQGYCEQISTALAVMLRTLGIPAREAVGYVPGPFDPLSGLYAIEARDAHAWVQVYFPDAGWQSFDPTADVPLAPANPGTVLLHDLWHHLAKLPWTPIGSAGAVGAVGYASVELERRRRRRPPTWAGRTAWRLERLGRRAGVPREPTETAAEYGARLATSARAPSAAILAELLEERCYGPAPPTAGPLSHGDAELAERAFAELRRSARRRRRAAGSPAQASSSIASS